MLYLQSNPSKCRNIYNRVIWHSPPWPGCTKSSERLWRSFSTLCLKHQELKATAQRKMLSPETSKSRWLCLSRFGCTVHMFRFGLCSTWHLPALKKDALHTACSLVQERLQALELWQTAAQELEQLQQTHQRSIADGKIIEAQRQKLKVQQCRLESQSLLVQFELATRWSPYDGNYVN